MKYPTAAVITVLRLPQNLISVKTAKELSLAESSYLAALPQAPSYYSPYGYHLDELENRKKSGLKA